MTKQTVRFIEDVEVCAIHRDAEVAKWFANGEYDKIREHCREDVELTDQIYRKFKGALF